MKSFKEHILEAGIQPKINPVYFATKQLAEKFTAVLQKHKIFYTMLEEDTYYLVAIAGNADLKFEPQDIKNIDKALKTIKHSKKKPKGNK